MRLLELFRPFQVVAGRRVSEEETVSVQVFCRTRAEALGHLNAVLETYTEHRRRYNDRVVDGVRQQLLAVEGRLENRGEELRQLENDLDAKRAELAQVEKRLTEKKQRAGLAPA